MRVITGTARGRKLEPPQGLDTRPTTELVKEAVMSIIQFEIPGAIFLDLFAGCGQMGIEALSRGARHCTFVDNSKHAASLIHRNVETTGFAGSSRIVSGDAGVWIRSAEGPFDIAYIDPPYGQGLPQKLLQELSLLMRENGVILVETAKEDALPETVGGFAAAREYHYGKVKITKYIRAEEPDSPDINTASAEQER